MIKRTLLLSALFAASLLAETAPNLATTPVPRDAGWMKRHESFNVISKKGEAQLVFLGDSITQGWEKNGKEIWEKSFAPRKAANFGISGDRTEHVLWRLQNGNFDGLKPKLVVIMIGTNNVGAIGRPMPDKSLYACSAEQTAEGVKLIVETLKKKVPTAKILLLGIFPRGATPADPKRIQNTATNDLIAKLDDGKTVYYLDIAKAFLTADGTLPKETMPDLLHLTPAAYQMWADAIEPKVKELLGE